MPSNQTKIWEIFVIKVINTPEFILSKSTKIYGTPFSFSLYLILSIIWPQTKIIMQKKLRPTILLCLHQGKLLSRKHTKNL